MRNHSSVPIFLIGAVAASLIGVAAIAGAQEQTPSDPVQAQQQLWSGNQLDNLVAPIALYSDPLLSQMLVASTYPLEVVEANQWLKRNTNLRGQDLINAARQQSWDPSIQALVAVPDALEKLNQDIRWTTDLGDAFLSQETDVMSSVQRMRARAQANGRLASTRQQIITTQEQEGQPVVVIQPASPDVIYVPVYDPSYIWGSPVYGFYPPLYYPMFGFGFGIGYDLGYCFAGWGGWGGWGWGPSWFSRTIVVNNSFFRRYGFHERWGGDSGNRLAWVHDPIHRRNVPYPNAQAAARFGGRSTTIRNSYGTGAGSSSPALPRTNQAVSHFAEHNSAQGYRNASPQAQQYQSQAQPRNQATPQYREGPRVVPFGNQRQQDYQAPQQYRAPQQTYRAPRVQQFQGSAQPRFQAPQQFHSAPRMSAPRFSGGGGGGSNRVSGSRRR